MLTCESPIHAKANGVRVESIGWYRVIPNAMRRPARRRIRLACGIALG